MGESPLSRIGKNSRDSAIFEIAEKPILPPNPPTVSPQAEGQPEGETGGSDSMLKRPLTNKDGEVRPLTAEDFKHFRPIAEVKAEISEGTVLMIIPKAIQNTPVMDRYIPPVDAAFNLESI